MRCSRTPPRTRARKAEAREGITRYSVECEDDDEDEWNHDEKLQTGIVYEKIQIRS